MKKIFVFLLCLAGLKAFAANDSLFQYILVPQQATIKTGASLTFQLLKYNETAGRYNADLENGMKVEKWLINGKPSQDHSAEGWFEGFSNFFKIKYHAPAEKPKDKIIRVSCEFLDESRRKNILFAYIEIEEFSNGFCIDPMNVDVGQTSAFKKQCFYIERNDFKTTRENMGNTLEKASTYGGLSAQQKLQIEQLKAQQKMVNKSAENMDWVKTASNGTAVYNKACQTLYISIGETTLQYSSAISIIVPGNKPGTYYTAFDKCLLTCGGGKPLCPLAVGPAAQGYISQYCKKNETGACEPVVIPCVIHIEALGKEGQLVIGYFSGKTGKVLCDEIPEIHSIYGYFSVIRQPDIDVPCDTNKY